MALDMTGTRDRLAHLIDRLGLDYAAEFADILMPEVRRAQAAAIRWAANDPRVPPVVRLHLYARANELDSEGGM